MATEGYDVEVVHDIPMDFNCVICLKLMRNPVQFKCGHGMCSSCYQCLRKKTVQRAGMLQCPQCREKIKEKQVFPNTMLKRLILQLKVQCSNAEFGCEWIDSLDNLEEHLKRCNPAEISRNSSTSNAVRKRHSSGSQSPGMDPLLQSDLLLSINDQLSTLEKKLDTMSNKREDMEGPSIPRKGNGGSVAERKRCRTQKPLLKKTTFDHINFIWSQVKRITFNIYITPLILLIASLCVLYAKYYWLPSDKKLLSEGQSMSSIDSHDMLLNDVRSRMDDTGSTITMPHMYANRFDMDNRAISHIDGIAGLVLIFIKMEFERMKSLETEIVNAIPLYDDEIQTRLLSMDKTFSEYIEMSWIEISRNISEYDVTCMKLSLVENISSLDHVFKLSRDWLTKTITNGIDNVEAQNIEAAKKFCEKMRERFEGLLHRIHMFSEYDFRDNIYKKELFRIQGEFAALKANITRTSNNINATAYTQKVRNIFDGARLKYHSLLNSYFANVTYAISYEVRFKSIMEAIHNRDFANGNYIWHLNTTKLSTLPKERAFVSESFISVFPYPASLLLYRDRDNKGYWKITFHQEEYTELNVQISILNQMNENKLVCAECSVGESKKDDSAKIKKFFKIPLTFGKMRQKGFVKDDSLYVRCTTR